MVAEVGKDAYQPQQPEPIEEPEFAVSLGASQVTISVALPRCSSLAADGEVELEHSSRRLFLKVEGVYHLRATQSGGRDPDLTENSNTYPMLSCPAPDDEQVQTHRPSSRRRGQREG
jgi:hypothetical protein